MGEKVGGVFLNKSCVAVCKQCESIIIPDIFNVEMDVSYELNYDFRKHILECTLCTNCMSLIRNNVYTTGMLSIIEDINDIMEKYNTKNPKVNIINVTLLDSEDSPNLKEMALTPILKQHILQEIKNETGLDLIPKTTNYQKISEILESLFNTLNTLQFDE